MKHETIIKRILEASKQKHEIDQKTKEEIELAHNATDADIKLIEKEATIFKLIRKPRIYVILFIFFRYQIPIMYHRAVNFITGS